MISDLATKAALLCLPKSFLSLEEHGAVELQCLDGEACQYCTLSSPADCQHQCLNACEMRCGGNELHEKCLSLCDECLVTSSLDRRTVGAAEPRASRRTIGLLSDNMVAQQSSTSAGGVASRAVDGITDGNYHHSSCTMTEETPAWWQVDLGQTAHVTEVRLWNRGDCCSDGLKNFQVQLCKSEDCSAHEGMEHCTGLQTQTVPPHGVANLKCNHGVGRFVRVRIDSHEEAHSHYGVARQHLALCEVQVTAMSSISRRRRLSGLCTGGTRPHLQTVE